jgi:hypothetical protein
MKASNKILLITIIAITVFIIILVFISRLITGPYIVPAEELTYIDYSIIDFSGIRTNGIWEVNIRQDDEYSVRLNIPENYQDYINVIKRGDLLDIEKTWDAPFIFTPLKAEITMPDLEKIESNGAWKITFSGFTSQILELDTQGMGKTKGYDSNIEYLELDSSGAMEIDLKDCRITDAKVYAHGTINILLTMNGGEISGEINGATQIEYYGAARSLNITTSGASSVEKMD